MSNFKEITKLDNLENKLGVVVKTEILGSVVNNLFESNVSLSWDINTGEKITEETKEDVKIIGDDLGNVEISQGSHEQALLRLSRLSTLEGTGDDQHGLDSS